MQVCCHHDFGFKSPPSRAAWIEMGLPRRRRLRPASRRLHGRRGLKCRLHQAGGFRGHSRRLHGRRGLKWKPKRCGNARAKSPPSRAAWIEMVTTATKLKEFSRRRLHGRRGLKCRRRRQKPRQPCRRLHGRRGLKWTSTRALWKPRWSPPSRAAWIEISDMCAYSSPRIGRRLHGRRGLK